MTRFVTTALLIASVCTAVLSAELSGFVQWNEHCPDSHQLGQAKVVLDNSIASGSITRDGRFVIEDIAAGVYILSVVSHNHVFDNFRIDIPPEPESSPEVRPYSIGTPLNPPFPIKLPYPVKLVPRQRNNYFVPHQSFSIMSMFQNPMMLLMVFSGVMMLAMPYITKNMDPGILQEAQENQALVKNALQSGDLKAGLPAVAGHGDMRSAVATATSPHSGSNNVVKSRAKKRRG